jgi:hypothetical protein
MPPSCTSRRSLPSWSIARVNRSLAWPCRVSSWVAMACKAVVRRSLWSLTRASATSRRSRWLLSRSSISSGTGGRAGAESLHPGGRQPDGRQHNRNQQDRTGPCGRRQDQHHPAGDGELDAAGWPGPATASGRASQRHQQHHAEQDGAGGPLTSPRRMIHWGLLPPPEHCDAECPRCCACRERLQAGRRLGWRRAEVWRSDHTPCVATREAGIAAAGGADRTSAPLPRGGHELDAARPSKYLRELRSYKRLRLCGPLVTQVMGASRSHHLA